MLRKKGVVGKFVEFYGDGLAGLPLADRATIANMAPEYGATCGIFPVDAETLRYLRFTGRPEEQVRLVEAYTKEQGLFHTAETPAAAYSDTLTLDLASVEPSLAGPTRPQDRVRLRESKKAFADSLQVLLSRAKGGKPLTQVLGAQASGTGSRVPDPAGHPPVAQGDGGLEKAAGELHHGSVVIAAITSCTNTSNPSVMLAAGLLAKKAAERGLQTKPWVKTSLAPGSKVVTDYLVEAGLMRPLEQLRFHLVGYGCTTCIAAGTPVLLANGTARRIEQMPEAGGAVVFGPTADNQLGMAMQAETICQGERDCVSLVLQDGRELVCTPDHEILSADGRWVRADQLVPGQDRVVMGLEAPLDEPGADEAGYTLSAGEMTLSLDTPANRLRTLAFARLLSHLLGDGSITVAGQGRINVGQAIDREVVLNDVEVVTGKRPVANQFDERKWVIVLPLKLTEAFVALPGVRVGRRIDQPPSLPAFVLDDKCPVAVVREFLGGLIGAGGHAPVLTRQNEREEDAVLHPPTYVRSASMEHAEGQERVMNQLLHLLARCGVKTKGWNLLQYPVNQDAGPCVEARLTLPDGLSFVERVGFRYSINKSLWASAAAVYWRTARRAIHGENGGAPAPVEVFSQLGVRHWFAPLLPPAETDYSNRYCVERTSTTLPTFSLQVWDRRPAGKRAVFDLSVETLHAFVAGSTSVHNCIGNSGPLPAPVSRAIEDRNLVVAAVLSGNRNFEGRVHPEVRANYLASPPLVVAYALAGRMDIDLYNEPLGTDSKGQPVYLRDVWPTQQEVQEAVQRSIRSDMFHKEYGEVFTGDEHWQALPVPEGETFNWDPASTYVRHPPYFEGMGKEPAPVQDVRGARVLALLGDSITTDHISPAGSIKAQGPAGHYLVEHGVQPADFNSYGSRRGNHEVMVRGTFANVRLRNQLAPGTEGGVTRHLPDGEQMSIYDASVKYHAEGVPLLVIAGKEYGSGSSRDWAAKGPLLLGVRAVLAESYERIHRSNLVGMGILPLQFQPGESAASLGLTGAELYDVEGLAGAIAKNFAGGREITVRARRPAGGERAFRATVRIDTPQEVRYYQHGGILQYVLRQLLAAK
jgi:aconitase A